VTSENVTRFTALPAEAGTTNLKILSHRSTCRTARTVTAPHPDHPYTPNRNRRTEKPDPVPSQVETAGREARNILPESKDRQVKEQRSRK
jgi:hypothetical protein